MCANCGSSSGGRGKSDGSGCGSGIAYSENGVFSGADHRKSGDLRKRGIRTGNGIRKFGPINGKNKLRRFGNGRIEKNKIDSGFSKSERRICRSCYARASDKRLFGKSNVFTGGNGNSIIRRHKSIKISIAKETSGRANWSLRSGGTGQSNGPLGTCSTGCTGGTNRAGFTLRTCNSLRTLGTLRTCNSLWSSWTYGSLGSRNRVRVSHVAAGIIWLYTRSVTVKRILKIQELIFGTIISVQ